MAFSSSPLTCLYDNRVDAHVACVAVASHANKAHLARAARNTHLRSTFTQSMRSARRLVPPTDVAEINY